MLLFSYNCDYYDYILYEKKRESEREIKISTQIWWQFLQIYFLDILQYIFKI